MTFIIRTLPIIALVWALSACAPEDEKKHTSTAKHELPGVPEFDPTFRAEITEVDDGKLRFSTLSNGDAIILLDDKSEGINYAGSLMKLRPLVTPESPLYGGDKYGNLLLKLPGDWLQDQSNNYLKKVIALIESIGGEPVYRFVEPIMTADRGWGKRMVVSVNFEQSGTVQLPSGIRDFLIENLNAGIGIKEDIDSQFEAADQFYIQLSFMKNGYSNYIYLWLGIYPVNNNEPVQSLYMPYHKGTVIKVNKRPPIPDEE